MIDFKQDRLTYSDLLAPPADGFELVRAVGTTYSLDLYALLALPVAMFYQRSLDGSFVQNRYDVLEAIRKCRERVTLFCQRGKIHVPPSYTSLLAFAEHSIIEVQPDTEWSSFHPKIWVLRFEKKREVIYRLAVLSRNLTFDRSWDIAAFMDGKPQHGESASGKCLVSYLRHFYKLTGSAFDARFLRDLTGVKFELPSGFFSADLFPIIGSHASGAFPNPLLTSAYQELLVVTPFVDADMLAVLKLRNGAITLLSTKEQLDELAPGVLDDFKVYYFNEGIRDGERILDSEGRESFLQDLHAKMFIGRNGKLTDWLIGSANGTMPALNRNTEFMVRLCGKTPETSFVVVRNILLDESLGVFLPYTPAIIPPDEGRKTKETKLRRIIYRLGAAVFSGSVIERTGQETYNLQVEADLSGLSTYPGLKLYASLLHQPQEILELFPGGTSSCVFENIALTRLSRFLAISIELNGLTECRLVIKIDLINAPAERDDTIFNELINSRQSFYKYLQFLLAPDEYDGLLDIIDEDTGGSQTGSPSVPADFSPPIYEYLMMAASRAPGKLKEVDQIMIRLERMNSDIVADFKPVWDIFKKFADA